MNAKLIKTAIAACGLVLLCQVAAQGQVLVNISPTPKLQFEDVNGKPLTGGCVFTYAAGTTTPQATYTDSTGATQNANPVILDSGGRASIWLNSFQTYKFAVWSNGGFSNNNCAQGQLQYITDGINAAFSASSLGITGIFTAPNINGVLYIGSGPGQYSSMAACYAALPLSGGTCVVPSGWGETWTSNLTLSMSNAGFLLMGCNGTITMGSNQLVVKAGVAGAYVVGSCPTGAFPYSQVFNAGGWQFVYTGSSTAIVVGQTSGTVSGNRLENFGLNLSGAGSSAIGIDAIGWQAGGWIRGLAIFGPGSGSQVGIQTDPASGGANSFDFSIEDNQIFQVGNGIVLNSNTQELYLAGNQIDCINSAISAPITGSTGLTIAGSTGTLYSGGNIVNCATDVALTGTAARNIVLVTLGNATTQVSAGSSTANNWVVSQGGSGLAVSNTGTANVICTAPCQPTTTTKTGTGSGSYSTASTSFTNVDGTNLSYAVTIPTGWKLLINATANLYTSTASTNASLAIADGGTPVAQTVLAGSTSTTLGFQATLLWVITGDGNSHTITLQYKTSNGSDAAGILNAASGVPVMTFLLTPSN